MGIEPTPRTATARSNGFEDRESHQAPCASGPSLAPAHSLACPALVDQARAGKARADVPRASEARLGRGERGGFGGHFCGGKKGGGAAKPPANGDQAEANSLRRSVGVRGALLRRGQGWGAAKPPAKDSGGAERDSNPRPFERYTTYGHGILSCSKIGSASFRTGASGHKAGPGTLVPRLG